MAHAVNHGYADLASRLTAYADGITNAAAKNMERDLRDASAALAQGASGLPVTISALVGELSRIANDTTDKITQERLRRLLGGA